MTNELKPLDKIEQDKFEHQRTSADVVQSKCRKCGAWYETLKQSVPFTEHFFCDCGERFEIEIPAASVRQQFLSSTAIADDSYKTGDGRLDTGMKVTEAIQRARIWWDQTGRREMQLQQKKQRHSPAASSPGLGGQFATLDPDDPNFLPSGLIHGDQWDDLDKRSKLMVVKAWHHYNVRLPETVGGGQKLRKFDGRKEGLN